MESDTSALRRKPSESSTEWLDRLEKIDRNGLAPNQRNYLSGYLDVARVAVRADEWDKNKRENETTDTQGL